MTVYYITNGIKCQYEWCAVGQGKKLNCLKEFRWDMKVHVKVNGGRLIEFNMICQEFKGILCMNSKPSVNGLYI